ncbi:AMP-binding protein [Actinomadura oligospora]|uniref:AMP-binding protein n=1 Tax=Actinomadura oligospora TaxID=111804 RepID=UPI0004B5367D|nr:AMP-binding protein [Actinomadura oligospora]
MTGEPEVINPERRGYHERGWWRNETFLDDLDRWAREAPDRLAVVGHTWETARGPDRLFTYAELKDAVDRCAAGLAELGVRRGDRVAMQLVNQWQATVLALGCGRLGAVVVPYFIATGDADTEVILRRSGARVAVTIDGVRGLEPAAAIARMRDRLPDLRHLVVVGEKILDGAMRFEEALLAPSTPLADLDLEPPGPDDLFQIMYTSGTTGQPKGVRHSFNTLYAMARGYVDPLGLTGEDVLTTPCIVGGQGGWLYGMLAPLLAGATAVWSDAFGAADLLDLAQEYGLTTAYITPSTLDDFADEQDARPRELKLRHLVAGSIPIPPAMPGRLHDVFGISLLPLWGMTENGGVTIGRPGDPADIAVRSDGRPVDWMELRLVGDDGAPVPDGEPGRLEVRGANMCLGYQDDEALFAESLHDGWFVTGDLARPDGLGGIKIVGRVKDMVNRNGVHVPGVVVEGVLREHPNVAEVAVVGEPDPVLGERVVAVVVPRGEPPTLDALRDAASAAGLTLGYAPDRLELVSELPKTPTGKVRKRDIEEELARRAAAHPTP